MSKRSKPRRSSGPRRKRLRRPARLEAARRWIASGARVTPKTYAKWFGTDCYTSYQELQMLGVHLRPEDARWAVRPPPVPRRSHPAPHPPPSPGSGWVEFGGTLMLPVGYTEGGCPFGPTLDDLEPEEREGMLADLRLEPSGTHADASGGIDEVLRAKQAPFDELIDPVSLDLTRLLTKRELFSLFGLADPP